MRNRFIDQFGVRAPRVLRQEIRAASGLNALTAAWLLASPWVLGYERGDPVWNALLCGSVIGVLATVRVAAPRSAGVLSWVNAFAGAWLFTSAFALDASPRAAWNVGIAGIVVFYLAVWSGSATDRRRRGRQ